LLIGAVQVIIAFSFNIYIIAICLFIFGFVGAGFFVSTVVYVYEISSENLRKIYYCIFLLFQALGLVAISFIS